MYANATPHGENVSVNNERLKSKLWRVLSFQLPRIMTQFDRDIDSPTCGCFDRDWWHYKIRDFPSIILQQGLLVLDALRRNTNLPGNPLADHPYTQQWVDKGISFWAERQLRTGGFEEYYPFESGFPPTAFSLYAVGYIFAQEGFPEPTENVGLALNRAVKWLLAHPEEQALNQEMAGLAGMALAARIPGVEVDEDALENRLAKFFSRQSVDGWFPEYDGPDIGYLAVTLDALWDYYEFTGDSRARTAMKKACEFMAHFVSVSGRTPVMTNSRNTDYIVPYGLVRFAGMDATASALAHAVFDSCDEPEHFLHATDDRYACHYIMQSCYRCLPYIDDMTSPAPLPCQGEGSRVWLSDCGILAQHRPGRSSLFVAAQKGGVTYIYTPQGLAYADFGHRCTVGKGKFAVNHWQNPNYDIRISDNHGSTTISISGEMSVHGWMKNTPMRHMVLRAISFFCGQKVIPLLKQLLIFKAPASGIHFTRKIEVHDDHILLSDTPADQRREYVAAPQYSLRHVASAFRFSSEEYFVPDETARHGATRKIPM